MRKSLLAFALTITILSSAKSEAAFDEQEMEAWSILFLECGWGFQSVLYAGAEDIGTDLKETLFSNAETEGASDEQLSVLQNKFEEGQRRAEQDGYSIESSTVNNSASKRMVLRAIGKKYRDLCVEWKYEE